MEEWTSETGQPFDLHAPYSSKYSATGKKEYYHYSDLIDMFEHIMRIDQLSQQYIRQRRKRIINYLLRKNKKKSPKYSH